MSQGDRSTQARVICVSGANRGIGKAIAERLYLDGYQLSLGVRQPRSLSTLTGAMDARRVMSHRFDASEKSSAQTWVTATVARFGRLDGVVNNAGIIRDFSFADDDETALDEMWEVNAKGPLRVIRAAFPHLAACGSGRVVNIVSLSGKRVKGENIGGYAMSKHAAAALTQALKFAGWDAGIRTTAICPGYVATDMTADVAGVAAPDMVQPGTIADLVATVLALPNTASVPELNVNCVLEHSV